MSSSPGFGRNDIVGKPPGGACTGSLVMLQSWHCSHSHSSSPSVPGRRHFTHQHHPTRDRTPKPGGCGSDFRCSLPGPRSTSPSSRQGKQRGWASFSLCLAPAIEGGMWLWNVCAPRSLGASSATGISSKHCILVIHTVSLIGGSWTRFGNPAKAQDSLLWEMLYSNRKEIRQLSQNEIPKELFHSFLLSDPCLSPLDVWMYSRYRQYQVYNLMHRPKFPHCKLPSREAISASTALELL